jgi:hypothetical protein
LETGHEELLNVTALRPRLYALTKKLVLLLHGGGQRAHTQTVKFWASHGYAAIAVNWGELPISDDPDDSNTDWTGISEKLLQNKKIGYACGGPLFHAHSASDLVPFLMHVTMRV